MKTSKSERNRRHGTTLLVAMAALFMATAANAQDEASEEAPAEAAPVEAAATEAAPVASPAVDLQTAEQEYDLRVRELEGKINDLKEQIHRSRSKLLLLTQAVTEGGLGQGAKVVIVHRNEMSDSLLLTEMNYFLDGAPLRQEIDESGKTLSAIKNEVIWEGNIVEGSHTLNVQMTYTGNGTGVFSYLAGYTWNLKDTHTFSAEPGKLVIIEAVGYEQGNFTTELTERPTIRFDTKVEVNRPAPEGE